jgi:hypothetical protein
MAARPAPYHAGPDLPDASEGQHYEWAERILKGAAMDNAALLQTIQAKLAAGILPSASARTT